MSEVEQNAMAVMGVVLATPELPRWFRCGLMMLILGILLFGCASAAGAQYPPGDGVSNGKLECSLTCNGTVEVRTLEGVISCQCKPPEPELDCTLGGMDKITPEQANQCVVRWCADKMDRSGGSKLTPRQIAFCKDAARAVFGEPKPDDPTACKPGCKRETYILQGTTDYMCACPDHPKPTRRVRVTKCVEMQGCNPSSQCSVPFCVQWESWTEEREP